MTLLVGADEEGRPAGGDKKLPLDPALMLRKRVNAERTTGGKLTPGWKSFSQVYTELAESRSGRDDVVVVVAPNAPEMFGPGIEAPGVWHPASARIALDGTTLGVEPENLDATNPKHFKALSAMHGVFIHECGHAKHTPGVPADWPKDVSRQMAILEEIRMEARTIDDRPKDAKWLRAASKHLLLDAEAIARAEGQTLAGAAMVSALTEGRVAAGSLKEEDVKEIAAVLDGALEPDLRKDLRELFEEVVQVEDDDVEELEQLARRFKAMAPADEESGISGDGLGEAVGAAGDEASSAGADDLSDDGGEDDLDDIISTAEDDRKLEAALEKIDEPKAPDSSTPHHGHGRASADGKIRHGERMPTSVEQLERKRLAEILRKARWRDRTVTKINTLAPPGRLHVREAVRAAAERDMGKLQTAKPWSKRKRKHVDMPRLRVGVLVDASGSMGPYQDQISSSLWVISNAVMDAEGTACGVAFGDAAIEVLKAGTRPKTVKAFQADGGTEWIADALDIAENSLNLSNPDGPRLVVVVSDGQWVDRGQSGSAHTKMTDMLDRNIRIVQVGIGHPPANHPATTRCTIRDASDLAAVVGTACATALAAAAGSKAE